VEAAGRLWFGHNKPGVASLPQSCRQVVLARATLKHNNKAHLRVWGSVRMKESGVGKRPLGRGKRHLTRANERSLRRRYGHDGRESLGQADGAQGVLIQPEWIRGCELTWLAATLRWRPRYCGSGVEGSYVCPGAARLKWTATKALAPEESDRPVSEKAPGEIRFRPTLDRCRVTTTAAARMGTRCRSGRRPGGSELAKIVQGSQAYLSLPPSCQGVSYSKAKQHGLHYSSRTP